MNNVIRMPLPQGLPLKMVTKEAYAAAKNVFDKAEFPTELEFPSDTPLEYVERGGETLTKAVLGDNDRCALFTGRIEQLPKLAIFWKISRITQNGKVFAAPTFFPGEKGQNPALIGCCTNIIELLGCDERLIGDIGPLEEIVPDPFGTLEPLGVDLRQYDLKARVDEIRRQLFLVLQHLKA